MNLYTVETGNFKLDGGAMFGVVPKSLWQKTNPADSNNLCNWAMRSLLIEDGDRLILIDTGIGDKQSEKFFSLYHLNGDDTLEKSLQSHGFHTDDVTDVILTHLHFDHVGGAIKRKKNGDGYELTFKNAKYWSNEKHWNWAIHPNDREKASFLKENLMPLHESGQLQFLVDLKEFGDKISFKIVNGHTESQLIPIIKHKNNKIVYTADLVPSVGHIPIPYIPSYDTRPLLSMDEKKDFLEEAQLNNYILFFEHDAYNECCTVQDTLKGVRMKETFKASDIF